MSYLPNSTMPHYIEDFIANNYERLRKYIDECVVHKKNLCDLQNVNFMCGKTPDYTDPGQQSLYLLRYGPAYIVEYRAAFEEILRKRYITPSSVCVLSIGCGTCLDKAAAFYAIKNNTAFDLRTFYYYGVDPLNWGYDAFPDIKTHFIQQRIEDVRTEYFTGRINVIIFPKSIAEISSACLNKFLCMMCEVDFENSICIIAANRNSDEDAQKAQDFVNQFCHDFPYEETGRHHTTQTGREGSHIWSIFEHFSFSQEAITLSKDLKSHCHEQQTCTIPLCKDQLDRCPVLRTGLFNTTIYCLQRKTE